MNAKARAGKRKASDEGLLLSAAQNSGGAVRGANDTPCVLLDANKREAEPTLKERAERKRKKAADTSATQKAAVKDAGLQFCSGSDNYDLLVALCSLWHFAAVSHSNKASCTCD